ncbi:hypothetical protein EB796_003560 [Bugula neritina]|uniref:Uncharacterized protein n=1 Tax=Bugula neritina TaxID=10212 RepID=A0A7J7KHU2_BUGNE|nr:hypothetical protein EB796_003560 [Bugula neritina]
MTSRIQPCAPFSGEDAEVALDDEPPADDPDMQEEEVEEKKKSSKPWEKNKGKKSKGGAKKKKPAASVPYKPKAKQTSANGVAGAAVDKKSNGEDEEVTATDEVTLLLFQGVHRFNLTHSF